MIEKLHIKGKFTANFNARAIRDLYVSHQQDYEFKHFTDFEIHDFKPIPSYDLKELKVAKSFKEVGNVSSVTLSNGEKYFKSNLSDVFIHDLKVYDVIHEGAYTKGKVEGIIYGTIFNDAPKVETTITSNKADIVSGNSAVDALSDGKISIGNSSGGSTISGSGLGGCFQSLGYLFGVLMLLSILIPLLSNLKLLLYLLLAGVAIWLIGQLLKSLSGIFPFLLVLLILFLGLGYFYAQIQTQDKGEQRREQRYTQEDKEKKSRLDIDTSGVSKNDSSGLNSDSVFMNHFRKWNNYESQLYTGWLSISQNQYFHTKKFRQDYKPNRYDMVGCFNQIYNTLSTQDQKKMPRIYYLYDSIRIADTLDDFKFAEMIVTCVQNIPYKLIVEDDCNTHLMKNPDDISVVQRFGCMGNVKFGVQSPSEFIYNLAGDCDTRSLFLYTVLSHYGYDVAILVSETYRHAILGINIPMQGYSVNYNGKKYFAWETTTQNMQPGQLSPDVSDMSNWNICIVNR